ncbi:hypothetical protein BGZ94_004645, partial [Podila epigama]
MSLLDLPDSLLLQIFSHLQDEPEDEQHSTNTEQQQQQQQQQQILSIDTQTPLQLQLKSKGKDVTTKTITTTISATKRKRAAGSGARALCRLCCCSQRLNHIASADQLWKTLTLLHFPDRHWPTTDKTKLDLIETRREHQRKLLQSTAHPTVVTGLEPGQENKADATTGYEIDKDKDKDKEMDHVQKEDENKDKDHNDKKTHTINKDSLPNPKRTKFYSRFEQRAHRRKFTSLDPALEHTPLAWTNTLWSWKRTYFGDCRFVESKQVQTPNRIETTQAVLVKSVGDVGDQYGLASALLSQNNSTAIAALHPRCQVSIGTIRILKTSFKYCQIIIGKDFRTGRSQELDQALEDPNCTPLLLYPSHSAVDIHSIVTDIHHDSHPKAATRYNCQDCQHHASSTDSQLSSSSSSSSPPSQSPSSYPYKLIIALDGSWSHAKIMYRCNPRLQQLSQIKFPNPPQSIYHALKPEPKTTYTSTAEA